MKHLPNAMTLLNAALGIYVLYHPTQIGVVLLAIAMLLDLADGLLARLLNVQSELGVQLDSMADLISFGIAPAYLLYVISDSPEWCLHAGIIYSISAVYRLARFNTLEYSSEFVGLPSPSAAGLIAGYIWWYTHSAPEFSIWIGVALLLLCAALMNVKFSFFSLKGKDLMSDWRLWLVAVAVVAALIIDPHMAGVVGFGTYILVSLISGVGSLASQGTR